MKKNPKRRSTIGENPLDAIVPRAPNATTVDDFVRREASASAASTRGLQSTTLSTKRGPKQTARTAARTGGTLGVTKKPTPNERVLKARFTFHLPEDLMERAKNAAFWSSPRVTLASMAEAGLRAELERLEKKNGGPFKARERELVGGRPIGT